MMEKKYVNKNLVATEAEAYSSKKAVLLGLPNLGLSAILGLTVSFVLLFFVNIMGQPPLLVGLIYSGALYLYAAFSVIGGVLSDKYGKKILLLISGPLIGVSFLLMWFPPIPDTSFGTLFLPLFIWYLLLSLLYRVNAGIFQPTLYSFIPEISKEEPDRINASVINMACVLGGTIMGSFFPIVLMGDLTAGLSRSDPQLYYLDSSIGKTIAQRIQILSIIISVLFIILLTLMLFKIKEPNKKAESGRSFKSMATPFKDKNFAIFLLSFFLFWIPFVSFQYLIINLGTFFLRLRGSEFIMLAAIALIFSFFSFILWSKLANKMGIKKVMSLCLMISITSFFLLSSLVFATNQIQRFILGTIFISSCLSSLVGTMIFPYTLLSKLIDRAKHSNKKESLSGSYSGTFTMVNSLSSATSMIIISIFLDLFGPEQATSYFFILVFGNLLILLALLVFQKVKVQDDDENRIHVS